jgi:hypothetical protein
MRNTINNAIPGGTEQGNETACLRSARQYQGGSGFTSDFERRVKADCERPRGNEAHGDPAAASAIDRRVRLKFKEDRGELT